MNNHRRLPLAQRQNSLEMVDWESSLTMDLSNDFVEDKLFQIGDVAKASGKTVRAIHHYEEIGLLTPHTRSKGRYRLYDSAALKRLKWISKMHDLGFSLNQIREIIQEWEASPSAPEAMANIRSIYLLKLQEAQEQMQQLADLQKELLASINYLNTCGTTCDPSEIVNACTKCNIHGAKEIEPELIAGIYGGRSTIRTNQPLMGEA